MAQNAIVAMTYIPHTEQDVAEMLATIGVSSIDDLFVEIPDNLKLKGEMNVPSRLDEHRLFGHLYKLSLQNTDLSKVTCFMGAGIYDKYIPSTVGALISRGEFLTAYTPYQPEVSQGYLQTIYEFQSLIAELYGCEIANASMYDGPTSMAEAAIMSCQLKNRSMVVVSDAVHPHYRQVLETYCWSMDIKVEVIRHRDGVSDVSGVSGEPGCIILQSPNFFGLVENLGALRSACDTAGAMMVVVADPTSCGLLKPAGEYGADIVVGEGQPLGIPMGFGGPLLGLFACKAQYARQIPGRIVGRTQDKQGRPGFTMTLRTREQDIRREKATSNICTNEALMALASTIYMCALGKNGMTRVAEATMRNTQYAINKLEEAGATLKFTEKRFGEFVIDCGKDASAVQLKLLERGFLAGWPLGDYYPEMANCLLVAVTEVRTKDEIDNFASAMKEVLA